MLRRTILILRGPVEATYIILRRIDGVKFEKFLKERSSETVNVKILDVERMIVVGVQFHGIEMKFGLRLKIL